MSERFRFIRPNIIKESKRNYKELIKSLEQLLDEYENCEDEPCWEIDDDFEHAVFEEVLDCFYGHTVWNYINERI